MDTEEATTAAETPPAADGSRWFYGCWIAAIALLALFALAAHAVTEFEKSLDGDGQMEQPGRSGSAYEPLGPGATARYEDGLRVTFAGYDVEWLNHARSTAALAQPLPEDDERTVPLRLKPSRKGIPVTVEVSTPAPASRDTAHFQLTLG